MLHATPMLQTILLLFSLTSFAAPCTTATENCTEWVKLGAGQSRSLIYRSYPLAVKNEKVTRAFVLVHGQGRDADNYFRTAVAAGFLANALDDTVIIAPRFSSNTGSCRDFLAANEVNWGCSGDSWRSGSVALNDERLSSYDLMDAILRQLARKDFFPNLKQIMLAGHSAGGQYVTRYAMANTIHDALQVPLTYIVSNPSSYSYLDATRPAANGDDFRPYTDGRNCTTYDRWPYGIQHRTGYSAKLSDEQLKQQLVARPVVYLLGELDTLPLAGFDASCPAMAQGPNRLARGQAYAKYVNQKFGAQHKVTTVPLCGHNARCIFTSEAALPIIFPKS
jgi:pimeloyl-ACP methyl ester carboxylesterase